MAEPSVVFLGQESQILAQKVAKSQTTSALKGSCDKKRFRNNSAADVSRKLFQANKPKLLP